MVNIDSNIDHRNSTELKFNLNYLKIKINLKIFKKIKIIISREDKDARKNSFINKS